MDARRGGSSRLAGDATAAWTAEGRESPLGSPGRRGRGPDSVLLKKGRVPLSGVPHHGVIAPPLARKLGALTSLEEIVLDLNVLARDHAYFAVDAFVVSDDGDFLAYSVDTTGFREYTLRVKDLRRDQDGPESIERVSSVAWAADGATLFYVTDDDAKRPHRLWRRRRGEEGAVLLHEEPDAR